MENILLAWSGGKDSALALHETREAGELDVAALLTTVSEDYDRVSMHGVRRELLESQARAIGYPLEPVLIPRTCTNEAYEALMWSVLEKWAGRGVTGVAFGDLFLEDIRAYRERNLDLMGMEAVFPLWGSDTALLARRFIELGFRAIVTCVDSEALDGSFVGRDYDEQFLRDLPSSVDPCGENGEFHTFVYDGPLFPEPLDVVRGEVVVRENRFHFCDLETKQKELRHSAFICVLDR
jgi:uncharacterized protein (TIGR00290 family)